MTPWQEPSLFDPQTPRARTTDPATSQAAADSLESRALGARCEELLALIQDAGGYGRTVAELVAYTGYDRGNTARRITDLRQNGLVVDSGRTRRAATGREQTVWVAAA